MALSLSLGLRLGYIASYRGDGILSEASSSLFEIRGRSDGQVMCRCLLRLSPPRARPPLFRIGLDRRNTVSNPVLVGRVQRGERALWFFVTTRNLGTYQVPTVVWGLTGQYLP